MSDFGSDAFDGLRSSTTLGEANVRVRANGSQIKGDLSRSLSGLSGILSQALGAAGLNLGPLTGALSTVGTTARTVGTGVGTVGTAAGATGAGVSGLGEAGEDEAVAPLSKLREMIAGAAGPRRVEYNLHVPQYLGDKREVAKGMVQEMRILQREQS